MTERITHRWLDDAEQQLRSRPTRTELVEFIGKLGDVDPKLCESAVVRRRLRRLLDAELSLILRRLIGELADCARRGEMPDDELWLDWCDTHHVLTESQFVVQVKTV